MRWWFETPSCSLWCHCDDVHSIWRTIYFLYVLCHVLSLSVCVSCDIPDSDIWLYKTFLHFFKNYFQNCVVCCCYNLLIHVYVLMTHICYVEFIHYLFKVFKKCFLHDLNFQDFQQRKLILDTTYWSCSWRWILYNMTSFILCKNLWQRSSIFECHRFLKDTWEYCIFYSYFITFTQNVTHYFEGSCCEQLYEYISSSYSLIYQDVIVHYSDVIMDTLGSQLTSLTIVYATIYSGADQRKQQSSAALTFAREIHRWLVNSPQKGPVTRNFFSIWWPHHEYLQLQSIYAHFAGLL